MSNRDIVAIGTSAGGVEALVFLAKRLPREFPASILVTIHLPSHGHSVLDNILTGCGPLVASFAKDREALRKAHIYIAPPDRHLLLDGDRLALGDGPRENNARPSIDPMLRSAAVCCCGRTIGVVLTGALGDGASGLWAVHECGGVTVVQDPKDAAFPDMPANALGRTRPDHVVRLTDMPALLYSLAHQPAGEAQQLSQRQHLKYEVEIARNGSNEIDSMDHMDAFGRRSVCRVPAAVASCGKSTKAISPATAAMSAIPIRLRS